MINVNCMIKNNRAFIVILLCLIVNNSLDATISKMSREDLFSEIATAHVECNSVSNLPEIVIFEDDEYKGSVQDMSKHEVMETLSKVCQLNLEVKSYLDKNQKVELRIVYLHDGNNKEHDEDEITIKLINKLKERRLQSKSQAN